MTRLLLQLLALQLLALLLRAVGHAGAPPRLRSRRTTDNASERRQ
jgi:hypothetical protein